MAEIKLNMDAFKPRKEWKRHKVKEGHNTYRILPPFGEQSNGIPFKRWSISWGLIDPTSGRKRPVASSITHEDKCPIFEYVNILKEKAETKKANFKAQGLSEEQIKENMAGLNKLINDLRPKTVYLYNAINEAGTVGLLELKPTAHKKLKSLIYEVIQTEGYNPVGFDGGLWFDIIRTGEMFDTEYDVKKKQNKIQTEHGPAYVDDRTALPDGIATQYDDLGYDLTSVYQEKSYDELKQMLMANVAEFAEVVPEADIEGFNDYVNLGFDDSASKEAQEAAGSFGLNLEENETKTSTPTEDMSSDELLAFADSVLDNV